MAKAGDDFGREEEAWATVPAGQLFSWLSWDADDAPSFALSR